MPVTGYGMQDNFLINRTLTELERSLGFHPGRLAQGATFVALNRNPGAMEFDLGAYSMIAEHRYVTPTGLDIGRLKANAMAIWTLTGRSRLVKVLPGLRHNAAMPPDIQYPPGLGVPQWKLKVPIEGTVVAQVTGVGGVYRPVL